MINIYGKISLIFILCILVCFCYSQPCVTLGSANCDESTSEFLMSTPGNIDFEFNNMQKYVTGITHGGSTQLRLKVNPLNASCRWKLIMCVKNNGHGSEWEPLIYYGSSVPNNPELDLIQLNVYNGCGTPLLSGSYQTFIGNVEYDIIEIIPEPSDAIIHMPGSCDGTPVNGPGSYLTNYNEYSFTIDYRISPGFSFSSGAYQIKINFWLVEVP